MSHMQADVPHILCLLVRLLCALCMFEKYALWYGVLTIQCTVYIGHFENEDMCTLSNMVNLHMLES